MTPLLDDPHITFESTFFTNRGRCPVCDRHLPQIAGMRVRSSLDKKPMTICLECYCHRNHPYLRADIATAVATHFPKLVEYWHNQQQE